MGKIKNLIKKYQSAILAIGVVLFSSLGVMFSYIYGYTSSDVQLYSQLMTLDNELKNQKDLNFIHGHITNPSTLTAENGYKKNVELQYKTIYKALYYNSYLLSTYASNNEVVKYSSVLNDVTDEEYSLALDDYSIAMVRNYWDSDYMESIGLPLYDTNDGKGHQNIGAKKSIANFGCYISSSQAYDIAIKLGLITSDSNKSEIKTAFDVLINPNNDYYLTLGSSFITAKYTINNIYIDTAFTWLMNDYQRSSDSNKKGNYYKTFSFWNANTIFTYASNVFVNGSNLYFDIRGSYNNINLFITNVLGKNYSADGTSIHFETQDKKLNNLSLKIDETCKTSKSGRIIYLLFSIIFFELLLLSHIYSISTISKKEKRLYKYAKMFLPFASFAILWLLIQVILMFTSSPLLSIYASFNYTGNIVSLVFIAVIIVSGFIWKAFGEEDEKII